MADTPRFDNADFAAMKVVERELVNFLIPHAERLHPILMCFTLLRCCRVFFRKGDQGAQKMLLPLLLSYLKGEAKPPTTDAPASLLWTPPGVH